MSKKKENNSPPKASGRKSTLLWIGLIFLISAWMFFLGVLVGRGTAPVRFDIEKLQKELALLKAAVQEKEIRHYKIRTPEPYKKPELEFHEALKSPDDHVQVKSEKPLPKKPVKPPEKKLIPEQGRKPPAVENGLYVKAMVESGRLYTIQVAASQDLKLAEKIASQLKTKSHPAYIEKAVIGGKGTWHRVRVGGFHNRTEAEQYLEKLKKEKVKGIIIKR